MTLLCFALLPVLFWDQGPETADQLKAAGITRVAVPSSMESAWRKRLGVEVRGVDPAGAIRLLKPGVEFRVNEASATRSPWIDLNGWQFLRKPKGHFYYEAPGPSAALAAAEAFAYGADTMVHTDAAGLEPLGHMLAFLERLGDSKLSSVADIGFVDDGSDEAGEVMNLMMRRNLLFRVVTAPDPSLPLHVEIGSSKFPKEEAADPSEMAQKIRQALGDSARSVRLFGSEVVIARLSGNGSRLRVELLNYGGGRRAASIRVRVRGRYTKQELRAFRLPDARLADFVSSGDATEFTLPELEYYAVVDLAR